MSGQMKDLCKWGVGVECLDTQHLHLRLPFVGSPLYGECGGG